MVCAFVLLATLSLRCQSLAINRGGAVRTRRAQKQTDSLPTATPSQVPNRFCPRHPASSRNGSPSKQESFADGHQPTALHAAANGRTTNGRPMGHQHGGALCHENRTARISQALARTFAWLLHEVRPVSSSPSKSRTISGRIDNVLESDNLIL